MNLSKPQKTHKDVSEHLKTPPEYQTKLQNLQDLFRTNKKSFDYSRTSENATELSWSIQNDSEFMKAPSNTSMQLNSYKEHLRISKTRS